ncbi:hypothetical protein MNBD_ALPHA02-2136 [hydrothermal vent metagenome]|uniref:Uncharacterized protein n=1 Tax=hydrothermal vent metagenome TaxID=652676 RepID=A0A3B0RNE5_9ZZZZ
MSLPGINSGAPSTVGSFAQAQYFQANFSYSKTSQFQATSADGQQTASFSSAVTLSLSVTAINVTTGFLAAENTIDATAPTPPPANDNSRAKGIEDALKGLIKELRDNNGLTDKVAKRLFKLVGALNSARGTDKPLGTLDPTARDEVRTARQQVNNFFQQKNSTTLVNQDLTNFIELVSKLETLREFALKTTDLLAALQGGGDGDDNGDVEEVESDTESHSEDDNNQPAPVNVTA